MKRERKEWMVEYSHDDGRSGKVKVITEITKSKAFTYGNGKSGGIIIGDFEQRYDLRYSTEKDLHMVMIKEYFGKGLVTATPISSMLCMEK